MADTWIVDMRHYLDESGEVGEMPAPALNLALFFGSIVAWMTMGPTDKVERTNVACRRSPGRKRCRGEIHAVMGAGTIAWKCPICGDNGQITGWQATPWDRGGCFEDVASFLLDSMGGEDVVERRKPIANGQQVPVTVSVEDRALIEEEAAPGDDLLVPLRAAQPVDDHVTVMLSLDEVEELQGYIAAAANHCESRRLLVRLDRLRMKLDAVIDRHVELEFDADPDDPPRPGCPSGHS